MFSWFHRHHLMMLRGATATSADRKYSWYAETLHIGTTKHCSADSMYCHWNSLARALSHFKMQKPHNNKRKQMFCTWNVKSVNSIFICIQHFYFQSIRKNKETSSTITNSILNFITKTVSVTHQFFHSKA